MKQLISYLVWLGGAVLVPLQLFAQTDRQPSRADSLLFRDYAFLKQSDPWLTSPNAAGLQRLTVGHLSQATLSLQYDKGHFTNYYGAPKALTAAAGVESFYRLSPDIVIFGKIAYRNEALKNLTGSAFVNPTRMPFDIVEDSLTNAGDKHLDTYQLTGAVSGRVYKKVSLGVKVDFTAANYAKYKDLRHKNKLMDIDASFALYWPISTWLNIGANYRYLRHSESLIFSTYSSNDITYKSFIEYGGMMGMVEQYSSSTTNGLTSSSTERPLFYDGHGYGVQAELRLLPGLTWTNTWDMAYLKGYYGKDTPYDIVYMRHHTHRYRFTTRLQYHANRSLHHLDASIENEKLRNFQNQYRLSTNDHGARYYEYFQPLKTADKVWVNTHIGYTGYFGLNGETPTWLVQGGARIAYRKLTAYNYPYYRRQHWTSTEGYLNVARNLLLRKGILTIEGGFSYLKGKGDPYEDGTFIEPSDKQTQPDEMTTFLYREYAALMAPQYALRTAVQYAFIFPTTQLKSYVRTDFTYRHCNVGNDYLQGTMHWNLGITLGVNF